MKSHLHHYEHETPPILSNDTNNVVDNFFYYDLARFYVETMAEMIKEKRIQPGEITYPNCGKHLSEQQLKERHNFRLYETFADRFMHGLFGQFIFDFDGRINYQELSMRINEIEFDKNKIKQTKKIAEWEFEGQLGRLYFTSAQGKPTQNGLPHYDIVTVIVSKFDQLFLLFLIARF